MYLHQVARNGCGVLHLSERRSVQHQMPCGAHCCEASCACPPCTARAMPLPAPSHPPMSDLGGGDRSHHRGTCSSGTETEQHAAPWRRRPPRSAISYLGGTQKEHVILLEKKRLFTDVRSRSTVFSEAFQSPHICKCLELRPHICKCLELRPHICKCLELGPHICKAELWDLTSELLSLTW